MQSKIWIILIAFFISFSGFAQQRALSQSLRKGHPRLVLTPEAVQAIKAEGPELPLMHQSVKDVIESADRALANDIVVPVPKDAGGGYTHEKHKQNNMDMYHAGIAFQITDDLRYARFVEDMLLQYADLYPTLGIHPEKGNQSAGKLFWQGLNETVWLVYTIQAYDNVRDAISRQSRARIEKEVFRRMVHFFTVENTYSFNRVHNHGTWAVAAIGMTGIVLGEHELVKQALWSTDLSGNGGFLKQLDRLFSPDGYYAEGPYYQRYALLPFVIFAQALENNYPDLKIFEYRGNLIEKMVNTALQLTDEAGYFFPYNNSIKTKNFTSKEIVFGVNIAYALSKDAGLLDVAERQGRVMISAQGLDVARDHAQGKARGFTRKSLFLRDGADGTDGGIAILRNADSAGAQTLVFKFSSQGMGHGHFDRLQYLFYEDGQEVIRDYGAARFVNVEPKFGGRYLPENTSWAKQTIAHNTVTLNATSHYEGKLAPAEAHAPSLIFYKTDAGNNQFVAAVDSNCYDNGILRRAMALVNTQQGVVVLDLFEVLAPGANVADYATYYQGQFINSTLAYAPFVNALKPLGKTNGYEHLWLTAQSDKYTGKGMEQFSFLSNNRFYTVSTLMNAAATWNFVRIGANDPDFNLRNEPGLIVSQPFVDRQVFASVVEAHGRFDPVTEMVAGASSQVKELEVVADKEGVLVFKAKIGLEEINWTISFDPDQQKTHLSIQQTE